MMDYIHNFHVVYNIVQCEDKKTLRIFIMAGHILKILVFKLISLKKNIGLLLLSGKPSQITYHLYSNEKTLQ